MIYPSPQSEHDTRFEVYIRLLRAALEATEEEYGPFELKQAQPMSEARYMQELAKNSGRLNVAWSGATFVDVASLRVIDEPIIKGLLSYRLLLVPKDRLDEFSDLSLDKLKDKMVAHAHGWGDALVFDIHELPGVETSYEGIYNLLEYGRVDYLNRGVIEAFDELKVGDRKQQFAVVPDVMVFYPWPLYFYVNRQNRHLETRISEGMAIIRQNGTQDSIIQHCYEDDLKRWNLAERKVLQLSNPWLEENWRKHCEQCWYTPSDLQLALEP